MGRKRVEEVDGKNEREEGRKRNLGEKKIREGKWKEKGR